MSAETAKDIRIRDRIDAGSSGADEDCRLVQVDAREIGHELNLRWGQHLSDLFDVEAVVETWRLSGGDPASARIGTDTGRRQAEG
ncbi:hypothetical protein QMK28_24560 [Streptomyces sp. H27-D2]|nr:hypothetical protein [Streptomyces sp. H27-D2]MEC4019385.1 hypothetical protein [Streptomyces sp. H27-D2]